MADITDKIREVFSEEELKRMVETRERDNLVRRELSAIRVDQEVEEKRHADVLREIRDRVYKARRLCQHRYKVEHRTDHSYEGEVGMAGLPTYEVRVCEVCGDGGDD